MEHLRCVVDRITYVNEQNGYTVLRTRVKGYKDQVTVVGSMATVHVGCVLYVSGEWRNDPKYGKQFAASAYEEALPATALGIEKYLGSGLVRGVGPKMAKRIVSSFGEKTLEVIEETPEWLLEVPGIGRARVEQIKKSWQEQKEVQNIMLFLQSHDVGTGFAARIYKTYGKDSLGIVTENPYRLADDIWGIGFKTADTIAKKLGFGHDRAERLRSGLMYTLSRLSEQGHCYALRAQLLDTGSELLEIERDVLETVLDRMIEERDLVREPVQLETGEWDQAVYLPPFFFAENGTARRLMRLLAAPARRETALLGLEERIRRASGVEYDPVQMQAILTALSSKVFLLTGGPGTGKTTTTQGIIEGFRAAGAGILLAAPTGRAAKRLSEATGMEARTLHRLLEVKPPEGYQRNEENPLEGDVLIVDECSMIDVLLMYNLLKAVPDHMRLILIGDVDQLPSVGAGNVLRDLIEAEVFPTVRLTRIFRQAQRSRIITNAHRVNEGRMPDLSGGKDSDFFFLAEEEPEKAANTIVGLVRDRLPRYLGADASQIQVLTPMQRGLVGAASLNQLLQSALNPKGDGLSRGGTTYRAGDRVMQIRNNYEKEVFNGDIGRVAGVDDSERTLTVEFDGRAVEYELAELDELTLAYATTIHKSQGSEYPAVVMPVMMTHYVMLQRNLIYTGITRAKRMLVMVGTRKALAMAIGNTSVRRRNTLLKWRLQTEAARGLKKNE